MKKNIAKKIYILFKLESFSFQEENWLPLKKDTKNHIIAIVKANNKKEACEIMSKHYKENSDEFDKGFLEVNFENVILLECVDCGIAVPNEDIALALDCGGSLEIID